MKSLSPFIGNMIRKKNVNLKPVGEPDAGKVARPVRRGVVGNVPEGNSLAAYPTQDERARKLVAET